MTPDELAARAGDVQIVDVRWQNEWDAGHIEGSVHIPQDELDDRVDEIARDRPVVTVCRGGGRSATAAEQLRADGLDVVNLDGGLEAWAAVGLPLVTSDKGRPGEVVAPEPPPDDRPEAHQRLQAEFLEVLLAVQEKFGETEPSDDEVRAFLRQRLIDEGRSPEEADEFMARLDE